VLIIINALKGLYELAATGKGEMTVTGYNWEKNDIFAIGNACFV
jgi:hypothetical protein